MPTQIEIKCLPDHDYSLEIRTLFCREAGKFTDGKNPLVETPFNELLQKITQVAFDEGRLFERKHGKLQ